MLSNVAEDETVDDFPIDENSLDLNQLLDALREDIKFDETIAMKSAMLLKLLEVSKLRNGKAERERKSLKIFSI